MRQVMRGEGEFIHILKMEACDLYKYTFDLKAGLLLIEICFSQNISPANFVKLVICQNKQALETTLREMS